MQTQMCAAPPQVHTCHNVALDSLRVRRRFGRRRMSAACVRYVFNGRVAITRHAVTHIADDCQLINAR
jgi:hypothetical protein